MLGGGGSSRLVGLFDGRWCRCTGVISVSSTPRWTVCGTCCATSGRTSSTWAGSCFPRTRTANSSKFSDCTTAPTTSRAALYGLSCVVYDTFTQLYAHAHEQFLKLSVGFRFRCSFYSVFVTAALRSRCRHYILLYYQRRDAHSEVGRLPRQDETGGRTCGLSANLGCRSEMCCTRLAEKTGRKNRQKSAIWAPSHNLLAYIFATKHVSTIRKNAC